jgi:curved DNA-binding protein CbpA
MSNQNSTIVPCPACGRQLRLEQMIGKVLEVKCPWCRHKWDWQWPGKSAHQQSDTDYYELLQVSVNADTEIIKAAYRRLAFRYHPDRNPGNETARRMMVLLNEARDILTDPQRRAAYDEARRTDQATKERREERSEQADAQEPSERTGHDDQETTDLDWRSPPPVRRRPT